MRSSNTLAFLASLYLTLVAGASLSTKLERRSVTKLMIFDCANGGLGDVCDNMCYGANCKSWGDSFTWDKPSKSVGSKRSTKAGCGSGNRCSKSPYGSAYQCDEFPFKSVSESDKGGQVNRCVKTEYNNAQSQVIKNFYNSFADFKGDGCDKKYPCQFSIVFSNAGNIGYCTGTTCANDGNEYTKDGLAKRNIEPQGGYYRLASGDIIYSPSGTQVGALAYKTVPKNITLFNQHNLNHVPDPNQGDEQYDYMMGNLDLVEDQVVEAIGANATAARV